MLDLAAMRVVLFDMDGVLYRGQTVLPGVHELLDFCAQHEIRTACITNNATRTQQQYAEKLAGLGLPIPGEHVLTSALATGYYLRQHYPRGTRVCALGMEGLHDALFGDAYFVSDTEAPDLVVQGADFALTYEKLRVGCLALRSGARFIATNPDRTFPSEEGLLPGAGSQVAMLQAASGVEPLFVGKPQPTMFRVALDMLDSPPEVVLMVGDRLDTDIAGARSAGLASVLALTGVTRRDEIDGSPHPPDLVVEDMRELLAAWQARLGQA
jgi:4-nitrophenyl phosphatase